MSLVGSPFGGCLKPTNSGRKQAPKREEEVKQEEPQETYVPRRRNEPFGNCWGTSTPKPKVKQEPKPEPQEQTYGNNYGWDPREPFRYPGNI